MWDYSRFCSDEDKYGPSPTKALLARQAIIEIPLSSSYKILVYTFTNLPLSYLYFATMSPPKAMLVLTGAWHVPEHYQKVTSLLEDKGIRTICPALPTNNNAYPPNKSLHHDIKFIKDIIAKEAAAGTHLTVVAHSWGGMLASAICADFAIKPSDNKGGVTNIFYMAAFIPSENESLAGLFGGNLPPSLTPLVDGTIVMDNFKERFFNDLSPEEAERAEGLLVYNPTNIHYTPISCDKVAWRTVPVSYLICDKDAALPSFVQEQMVQKVKGEGFDVKEYRLPASHSPFLSMPGEVTDIIIGLLEAY